MYQKICPIPKQKQKKSCYKKGLLKASKFIFKLAVAR